MNSILLFAGNDAEALGKFLETRGSIRVERAFNNLFLNEQSLRNKLYDVDKLVYLCQDETMNVRQDMRVLKSLLINDSFFKTSSVLILITKGDFYDENMKYFKSSISEIEESLEHQKDRTIPTFNIVTNNDKFIYDTIYRQILGEDDNTTVVNTKKRVYRVERGSDSKKAFEPKNNKDSSVLSYSTDNLDQYSSLLSSALAADSGEILVDSTEKPIADKTDPSLGRISYNSLEQRQKVVLVSGINKSGSSTLVTAFASSFSSIGKKALLLDMTQNLGLGETLNFYNLIFHKISMQEILLGTKITQPQTISLMFDYKRELRFNLLSHICSNLHRIEADVFLIDADLDDIERCKEILSSIDMEMFLLSSQLNRDISLIESKIGDIESLKLMLSETISYGDKYIRLSPEEIKKRLPSLTSGKGLLCGHITFDNMDLDGSLVSTLLGVDL